MGISDDRKGIGRASRRVCAVCMGVAGIDLMLRGSGGDWGGLGERKGLSARKALRGNSVLLLPVSKFTCIC
jgi:hypothetical protein